MSTSQKKSVVQKEYDTNKVVLVGNFYNYTGPYEDQIKATKILSPYLEVNFSRDGKLFNSIATYLYYIRLMYGDLKEEILSQPISDVYRFYKRHKFKTEKLMKNLGEKIGIGNYDSADTYVISKTKDALNNIYDIFIKNKELRNALMSTENLSIVFVDEDSVLGDGLNGRGLNLYGQKLEEIRRYLRNTTLKDSLIEDKFNTMLELKLEYNESEEFDNFINENKSLNMIEKWAFKMMMMYANTIAKFFEYLSVSRPDFLEVIKEGTMELSKTDNELVLEGVYQSLSQKFAQIGGSFNSKKKQWRFPKKFKYGGNKKDQDTEEELTKIIFSYNLIGIKPIINNKMVSYVINEIFNCSFGGQYDNIRFPSLTDNFIDTMRYMIKSFIINPGFKRSIDITSQAISILWLHICKLCEHIYEYSEQFEGNEKLKINTSLFNAKQSVDQMKKEYVNHDMHTETENCALQAVLYNIVALTDWPAINVVGTKELNTCVDILCYNLDDLKEFEAMDTSEVKNVIKAFVNKGLIIDASIAKKILGFVHKMSENSNDSLVLNRIMFFSNII